MQLLLVSAPAAQDEDHHADDQAGQRQHNDKQQAERHNQVAGHRQCFGAHAAGFNDGSVFFTVHPVQDAAHKLGVAARNRCVDLIGKDIPAVDPYNRTARGCVLGGNGYNIQLDGFIPYGFEDADGGDFRDGYSYYEYNLEEAKALMEAAGYNENNRLSFPYLYSNGDIHEDIAVLLQQMWSEIYVDLELTSVEQGVFYDYVDNGDFTTCRYANNDSTDPLSFFQIFTTDSQIDGCQSVTDPVYDQMVAEAYTITDHTEYMAKLHEIEDYFVGEMQYVIPLMTQTPVVLAQSNLSGLWLTVTGSPMVTGITVE